jgi:hypothetical protein
MTALFALVDSETLRYFEIIRHKDDIQSPEWFAAAHGMRRLRSPRV